jgi:deoxycytidine triphosphate deaminase
VGKAWSGLHEHQERQVDPPHGPAARHDRAVRARPGEAERGWRAHRQLRHLELRLRRALRREFKIFTNINSTIVDPKHFDPSSFVDVVSDVCIIPPNSFALARTVEYFRIPRSTLWCAWARAPTRAAASSST